MTPKLLQTTQNYFLSDLALKVHELTNSVKKPPDIFQNFKTVQQQGGLMLSISESSKIHLLIKILYI